MEFVLLPKGKFFMGGADSQGRFLFTKPVGPGHDIPGNVVAWCDDAPKTNDQPTDRPNWGGI